MSDGQNLQQRILDALGAEGYTPARPRQIARMLEIMEGQHYDTFRDALRELMDEGRVALGSGGSVLLPAERLAGNELVGSYRHNQKGFGFVVPSDVDSHEDLFIPPGDQNGALTGDVVRAKIIPAGKRQGKQMYEGKILEIMQRANTQFAGTVSKVDGKWYVFPDGSAMPDPIYTPDAGSRYVTPGQKVIVEITKWPGHEDMEGEKHALMEGVISKVLGDPSDKDVDLWSVVTQYGLAGEFPEEVSRQAREVVKGFDAREEIPKRLDLTNTIICTIDPDDAKDYDDAISLTKEHDNGRVLWKLGVHIADVSHFVKPGTALDEEAYKRGNSTYFPGHVIPMLPEVLSNGVCSLQGGVPRLAKSAFIWLDEKAKPVRTAFSNSVIESKIRLRYVEAQDLIDGKDDIFHPDGNKKRSDYPQDVLALLKDMDTLAKLIQKRRKEAGQINLDLPQVELVLDEKGQVVDATEEDESFTHTLIEMFMVEANEAVARLFTRLDIPHMRRIHPGPDGEGEERLQNFVQTAGFKIPKELDRHAIQALLAKVKDTPAEFAINLAILKCISRAEYSPKMVGHFALASEHYSHFTSPIRRYADLTIHRLLDAVFAEVKPDFKKGPMPSPKPGKVKLKDVATAEELSDIGSFISYTERRSESAERELRQVKVLALLENHVGEVFKGVLTGITNFGVFIQLETYLIEGLTRFEDLMDDWWDVDTKAGVIKGKRTNTTMRIGDVVTVKIARVDLTRREMDLEVLDVLSRGKEGTGKTKQEEKGKPKNLKGGLEGGGGGGGGGGAPNWKSARSGSQKRSQRSKSRDKRKKDHRRDK